MINCSHWMISIWSKFAVTFGLWWCQKSIIEYQIDALMTKLVVHWSLVYSQFDVKFW